jgi:hypothetical protein
VGLCPISVGNTGLSASAIEFVILHTGTHNQVLPISLEVTMIQSIGVPWLGQASSYQVYVASKQAVVCDGYVVLDDMVPTLD